jgi:tetratricopeptide (TPR) repeat protein
MRRWIAVAVLCVAAAGACAQNQKASEANALFVAGKRIEALPYYEDLAKAYPNEMLYQERLADCLGAEGAQLSDPAQAKAVRIRERDAAKRAVALGDKAEYVRQMANLDPDTPLFAEITSPARDLLAEAEKAFTAGDFQTAMTKYVAAAQADPQLYEAPLYAGDTAYVQKDLPTAAHWFARAIAVDPNRETAYRYWGDAILKFGNDPDAAKDRFIDAIVSEPYNRLSWQGIENWAQIEHAVILAPKIERPPAPVVDPNKPDNITINIDPGKTDDNKNPGGFAWLTYSMIRATYRGDAFKKEFPNEKEYRHSLKEEDAALSVVASTLEEKKIKRDSLDESLRNLLDLNDAGMLDCWILINGADQGIAQDYAAYRDRHRPLLHEYLSRYVIHGGGIKPPE